MNDEVYIVYNMDSGEIISVSRSYNYAQEILMDEYMDALYYQFLWNINYFGMNAADGYSMAKREIKEWFRNYMMVTKISIDH